jgi:hypothetical protein
MERDTEMQKTLDYYHKHIADGTLDKAIKERSGVVIYDPFELSKKEPAPKDEERLKETLVGVSREILIKTTFLYRNKPSLLDSFQELEPSVVSFNS